MNIGNITFKFGILPIVLAVLGLFTLFTSPVSGITLIVMATLLSCNWRHRVIAISAAVVISLVIQQLWLILLAAAIGTFLFYKKVPHALAYFCWLNAAAHLLSGDWLLAISITVIGAAFWKLTPA